VTLKDRSVVSINDLSDDEIRLILDTADRIALLAAKDQHPDLLGGWVLATLFFEPSTRTRLSFESAMKRLGGDVIGFSEGASTSATKGETLADTIRMVSGYSDAAVLRHSREGAARMCTQFATIPIINGGDGAGQHPSQTLLDLFTIRRHFGKIEGVKVALVGDLKYGRTAHSLAYALARFGAQLTFVAPRSLQMPPEIVRHLEDRGVRPRIESSLEAVVPEADVLYMTRIQKERFPDPEEYEKVAGTYRLTVAALKPAKSHAIVLHPLPRVDEIDTAVDGTAHAKYFEQAQNGVHVRMALLALVMRGEEVLQELSGGGAR
jgi:aspartate carbamoyltransferase catalytic subunit